MSIATEKEKFASERFTLVRINPARALTFSVYSGSVYRAAMPYIVNTVQRNGVNLTKVNAIPSNNDEWYYDESSQYLYVKTASAPSTTTTGTNQVICFYYLYFTNTEYRSIPETPTNLIDTLRLWEPRLVRNPNVTQNITNILAGVFSLSDTSIEIINESSYFQPYLSTKDSFFNKDLEIWFCINDFSNIQKVFTGSIRNISLRSNTITITGIDKFNKLNQRADFGDIDNELYFRRTSGVSGFANLDPNAHDKHQPLIVGMFSRFKTTTDISGFPGNSYLLTTGNEAYDLDYSATVSTTTNRLWGTCRINGNVQDQVFGTNAGVTYSITYSQVNITGYSNIFVGDTLRWVEASVTRYGLILSIVSGTMIVKTDGQVISNTSTLVNQKSFAVFITMNDGTNYYPLYGRDYTISEVATTGGNKSIRVTFVNNFEANLPGLSVFHPTLGKVFYRTSNTYDPSHADFVQDILESVGFVVNGASFTQAETDLVANCRFQIPYFDEGDYKNYTDYLQDILASVISYIKLNESYEVEYHIIETPASSDSRDSNLILDNSFSSSIEYGDIQTTIIGYNPHNDSQIAIDASLSPAQTASSNLSKYLHGITNITRFRHVLDDFSTSINRHILLKSERRAVYSFDTAVQDIDTELGDNLLLTNSKVLGSSGTSQVIVTGISKSPNKISIECSDVYNI